MTCSLLASGALAPAAVGLAQNMGFRTSLRSATRLFWRSQAPPAARHAVNRVLTRRAVRTLITQDRREPRPAHRSGPLVVSGLFSGDNGIGEGGRLTLMALEAAGYEPIAHDVASLFSSGGEERAVLPERTGGGVWLVHLNPPEAAAIMTRLGLPDWRSRYRIGYWAYELPRAPKDWITASELFDEIWTPSAFVAESLRGVSVPLRVMPHPVGVRIRRPATPRTDDAPFTVLTAGDPRSSLDRKNIRASLIAYARAFPSPNPSARRLIVKVSPIDAPSVLDLPYLQRPDVVLRREFLDRPKVDELISGCDVFMSLHRSEGFGLMLAEAFALGRVGLATGWSGNLDFMSGLDGCLAPGTLVQVRDRSGLYRPAPGVMWMEPDIDAAALLLRRLFLDADLCKRLAAQGAQAVAAQCAAWRPEQLESSGLHQWSRAHAGSARARPSCGRSIGSQTRG